MTAWFVGASLRRISPMPDLHGQEREAHEEALAAAARAAVDLAISTSGRAMFRDQIEAAVKSYKAALAAREEPQDRWAEDEWHTDENGHVIGGAPPNFVFVAKSSAREDWIAERSNVEKERDELLAAREEPQDHETLIREREDQRERALEAGREVDELEDRLSTALERERAARERPKDSGMRIEGEVDP
jgi:hypothetical protein